ncbi:MAG: hypothetical protein Q3978_05725 [Limosilactobacillus gorillae]|uniref:hypothetical protein n=1 Tax=Limosilactobacillus gorillae TaxID=1450649 RepID=UPI000B82B114|nr:hypothetical protein [Limosilactobacillus gorillae]MDO4856051.1 hypothetical protein [Limosilactobacillus gorillae]
MISRAEYQRQQQAQDVVPQEEVKMVPHPVRRHFLLALMTVLSTLVFMIAVLANGTVLNKSFAKKELTNSTLTSSLQNTVNQSVSQSGYTGTVVSTKEANQLIEQVIDDVYEGREINVDLSGIESSMVSQASQQLTQALGISVNLNNSSVVNAIENQVTQQVNQELNTSQLQEVTSAIKIGKLVTNVMLVISSVVLLLCLVIAVFFKTVSFPITIGDAMAWVSVLFAGGLLALSFYQGSLTTDTSLNPLITQVETDVINKGWSLLIIPASLFICCLMVRVWRRIWG